MADTMEHSGVAAHIADEPVRRESSYERRASALLDDIRAMLDHAQRCGAQVDDALAKEIDELLAIRGIRSGERTRSGEQGLALAFKVHSDLSKLIAPVTPDSIRASSWRANYALITILLAGVVSIGLAGFSYMSREASQLQQLQLAAAAGLGSAFYALYTASKYIQERTFESRYNQIYLIRFVLGLFAGFILGQFADQLLAQGQAETLTQTTVALLGGFSAEAVAQLLQRISETLITFVRGSGKERAEAEMDVKLAKRNADVATKLEAALSQGAGVEDRVRVIAQDLVRR